jgi:hypothetical protein
MLELRLEGLNFRGTFALSDVVQVCAGLGQSPFRFILRGLFRCAIQREQPIAFLDLSTPLHL